MKEEIVYIFNQNFPFFIHAFFYKNIFFKIKFIMIVKVIFFLKYE
jgi:hypothetical protein